MVDNRIPHIFTEINNNNNQIIYKLKENTPDNSLASLG